MRIVYDNETEARTVAAAGALGLMVLLCAALFLFSISGTVPNPPPVEYVEVNFGTTDIGSGSVQTYNKPNPSPRAEDVKPSDERPEPKVAPKPQVERTPATPLPKVEAVKPSKVVADKPLIASKAESPVNVPDKVETRRPKPTPPEAPPASARPEPPKKAETVNTGALYKKTSGSGGSNGTAGRAEGVGGNNNGDNVSGVGDKGNPEGNINAKEFYGKPGGASSGVALNVSGWAFGSNKLERDDSDERGRIIFQIRVDSDGSIVSARAIQTTVNPDVVEFYRRQVQRFKLRPKGSVTPSELSTGTLTVSISAN
jgi:periplasmic protein TonB